MTLEPHVNGSPIKHGTQTVNSNGTPKNGLCGEVPASERKAVDLSHHLSLVARSRMPSPLKDILSYMHLPGMISLAGGLPHPSLFPFHNVSTSVYPPLTTLNPLNPAPPSESIDIEITRKPKVGNVSFLERDLQYSGGVGFKPLADMCRELTSEVQCPAYGDWDVLINCGSTDAWQKIVTLLCERGQTVITDEQIYPSAQAAFIPEGVKCLPIAVDEEGMRPDALVAALDSWDESSQGPRPHMMYLVPVGQNPLGITMQEQRRKDIYALACKYDLVIVEDDPYFMLQFDRWSPSSAASTSSGQPPADFMSKVARSFLVQDTEGRVIRLETFSKTLAPGLRIGFFVANSMFIERLLRGTEVQNQQPSAFSQIILGEVLNRWGTQGYLQWCAGLCEQYRVRRDWMLNSLSSKFSLTQEGERMVAKVGGKNVLSFTPPVGGMFIWCTVHFDTHPGYRQFVGEDAATKSTKEHEFEVSFWKRLVEARVLVTPGWYFTPFEGAGIPSSNSESGKGYFRLAYSFESREDMEEGIRRLADVMKKEWA